MGGRRTRATYTFHPLSHRKLLPNDGAMVKVTLALAPARPFPWKQAVEFAKTSGTSASQAVLCAP